MKFLIEIPFFVICIGLGRWQAWWFDVKQRKISHWVWAVGYCVLVVPVYFTHGWALACACVSFHLPVFNSALNWYRIPRRPLFYTNPGSKGGSFLDTLWGKSYPIVFWVSWAIIITLQFFIK